MHRAVITLLAITPPLLHAFAPNLKQRLKTEPGDDEECRNRSKYSARAVVKSQVATFGGGAPFTFTTDCERKTYGEKATRNLPLFLTSISELHQRIAFGTVSRDDLLSEVESFSVTLSSVVPVYYAVRLQRASQMVYSRGFTPVA